MFMVWLVPIIVILIILLGLSISLVETQSVNIIERFGKFVRIQRAGLNFRIPVIERIAGRVSLRVQQLDIIAETKPEIMFLCILKFRYSF